MLLMSNKLVTQRLYAVWLSRTSQGSYEASMLYSGFHVNAVISCVTRTAIPYNELLHDYSPTYALDVAQLLSEFLNRVPKPFLPGSFILQEWWTCYLFIRARWDIFLCKSTKYFWSWVSIDFAFYVRARDPVLTTQWFGLPSVVHDTSLISWIMKYSCFIHLLVSVLVVLGRVRENWFTEQYRIKLF